MPPTTTPAAELPPRDTPNDWQAEVIRAVRKETVTVRIRVAPLIEFRSPLLPQPVRLSPSLADVVLTSVTGEKWLVHGVTVSGVDPSSGQGVGKYFRRQLKDGTWAHGTPEWVIVMAEGAAAGVLAEPEHVCGWCGYAVTLPAVGQAWEHVPGADGDHPVRSVVAL